MRSRCVLSYNGKHFLSVAYQMLAVSLLIPRWMITPNLSPDGSLKIAKLALNMIIPLGSKLRLAIPLLNITIDLHLVQLYFLGVSISLDVATSHIQKIHSFSDYLCQISPCAKHFPHHLCREHILHVRLHPLNMTLI